MSCMQMSIPVGYTVEKRTLTMDIDAAVEILKTKKRRKYISAKRNGYDVFAELRTDVWKCPHCGFERATTLLASEIDKAGAFLYSTRYVNKPVIEEWGTRQTSIFRNVPEELQINFSPTIFGAQRCPGCHCISTPSMTNREVSIFQNRDKMAIRAEICSLEELLSMPWIAKGPITIQFPLFETVTFNFRRGKTHVELQSGNGSCFAKRDVTASPSDLEKSVVANLIRDNVFLSRTVKRTFLHIFDGRLPFEQDELSVEKYIMMTCFMGFPRRFYDSIPFVRGTLRIDRSFGGIAKKLHTAKESQRLLSESRLPRSKSIRRLFFSDSGLFFYLPECEMIWDILQDVNYFCRVLSGRHAFEVLSLLHQRPLIFDFLYDYACVKGTREVAKMMSMPWFSTLSYATAYCTMSLPMKLAEQKKWLESHKIRKVPSDPYDDDDDDEERHLYDEMPEAFLCFGADFLLPMREPCENIPNCRIDGFSFLWLRGGNDYYNAGKELKNCLIKWEADSNPVVVVKEDGKLVAAIEVDDEEVKQVRGRHNSDISLVAGLPEAYEKWLKKFNLKDSSSFRGVDDEEI